MAVLKANAYGLGLEPMGKICRKFGVKWLGVATMDEALRLRKSGDKGRILAWLYDPQNISLLRTAIKQNIDIALFDKNHINALLKATPQNKKANIHLFVDVGMNRTGIPYKDAMETANKINSISAFKFVGVMSHLCCSEKANNKETEKEIMLFRKLRTEIQNAGLCPQLFHIAATHGILNYDVSDFDMARSGIGIIGYGSSDLVPAVTLTSKIIQLKTIDKNAGIGYQHTYISDHKERIGIVPFGYADILSVKQVIVNGKQRNILGLENMDQVTIEATTDDKIGDKVQIFINADKNPANILVHLGNRINYLYL